MKSTEVMSLSAIQKALIDAFLLDSSLDDKEKQEVNGLT
jgi:hypothetical protein